MLTFTGILVLLIACANAQNSCESLVKYGRESPGGEGIIAVPAPKISSHELKVQFTLDSRLRSTNAGDIGLTKSAEDAVNDIRRGIPLNYRVKFPPGSQKPKIVRVNYNNQELCDENPDSFQTLVTLTHQLDTGVRLESENDDYVEDTFRNVPQPPRKVPPTVQIPRVTVPPKKLFENQKNVVTAIPKAELQGSNILQKISSGEFKPIAIINPKDYVGKDYGVQEIFKNNRYGGNKKDVDLILRIPGQYIENAVVAIVISVADVIDGTGQVVYQNLLNKP